MATKTVIAGHELEAGWPKALKLGEYVTRKPGRPRALQETLFSYLGAL